MGDVAMTAPVLRALRDQFPEIQITMLTRKEFAPIFEHLKGISIYPVDFGGRHKGIGGLWRLSKEIKSLNPTVIADLHNVIRTKLLRVFLIGYLWAVIHKGRHEKQLVVNQGKKLQLKSTHQRYADVFINLGYDFSLTDGYLPKTKFDFPPGIQLTNGEQLVGFAPFAGYESKTYPKDLSLELIAQLEKQVKVILFGGGSAEIKALNELASKFDNVICYAGKLTLSAEIQLISNLNIMIAMDSSNAHLAAMLGVEVISVWGITDPVLGFAPFGQPSSNSLLANKAIFDKIPTSVYGNKMPEGYEKAIRTVTPDMIAQLCRQRLKHHQNRQKEKN